MVERMGICIVVTYIFFSDDFRSKCERVYPRKKKGFYSTAHITSFVLFDSNCIRSLGGKGGSARVKGTGENSRSGELT